MSELLPCPAGHKNLMIDQAGGDLSLYWVYCITDKCGWCGPQRNTEQEAIIAWNTRANDKQKGN